MSAVTDNSPVSKTLTAPPRKRAAVKSGMSKTRVGYGILHYLDSVSPTPRGLYADLGNDGAVGGCRANFWTSRPNPAIAQELYRLDGVP